MIRLDHVVKVHHRGTTRVEVLRGLTGEIPTGAFAFVVGPSGSGKSTLLHLLGALDEPTSGRIEIDGRPLADWPAPQRDRFRREEVGFVFQSFNLLANLSAVDNVLMAEIPRGVSAQRRRAAADLLTRIGLGERLEHRPDELSGGEQQRVAIARALFKRPRLVLADEPTGELDSENGAQIFSLLRELHAQQGATIVTVTHDHRYLREGDLVLEIRDGRFV
jgi:putative ABC transport system ATP-binding protein